MSLSFTLLKKTLKSGKVVHAYNSNTWEMQVEDQKFKVSLVYPVNSRPAWAPCDSASKNSTNHLN